MTYLCEICNKKYITNSVFWKHNNKYHNNIQKCNNNNMSTSCQPNVNIMSTSCQPNVNIKTNQYEPNINLICINALQCKYCNKLYKFRQSKCRHEQKCKIKYDENNEKLKIENTKLKYEIELFKNNNSNQITTTNNNQITTNNNSNNNNNTVNNNTINIIKFGGENLSEILTEAEMMKIIKYINLSVNESIKMVHFNNKRTQYKQIKKTILYMN